MLITKPRFETFAEYLQYEDNSEGLYELFNGELIEMPPESGLNFQIANRLFLVFALMLGTDRVRGHGLETGGAFSSFSKGWVNTLFNLNMYLNFYLRD